MHSCKQRVSITKNPNSTRCFLRRLMQHTKYRIHSCVIYVSVFEIDVYFLSILRENLKSRLCLTTSFAIKHVCNIFLLTYHFPTRANTMRNTFDRRKKDKTLKFKRITTDLFGIDLYSIFNLFIQRSYRVGGKYKKKS